ncbi:MAG: hypothetical protein ACRD2A_23530, partial [Vicinamibacterales bacterium]
FTLFAKHEENATPPENAVKAVKAFFVGDSAKADADQKRGWEWAASLIPTLVFDSWQEALPAGVRAAAVPTGRYLLYAANDLMVDIHVDVGSRALAIFLAGQIANAAQAGNSLPAARVTLMRGKDELSAYRVSVLGEFHCEFEREENLALLITVEGREPIVIPLDRLFEPAGGPTGDGSQPSRGLT